MTGPPRDEAQPGVPDPPKRPAPPRGTAGASRAGAADREVRPVRAEDPDLSPETNARITEELQDVVGADRIRVPAERPRATRGEHPEQQGLAAYLEANRLALIGSAVAMLTFGAIVALITNVWWVLPLAAGVHAVGTMTVVLTTVRLTTISEHPSPQLAAALAEQGVRNPDEHFSRMVEEFRDQPERGATEVLSPGYNERTIEASREPAQAGAEQSSAMTPTAAPSSAGGARGAPDLIIWTTMLSLLALSIALPAALGGGWLWLLTAAMVPLIAGWAVLQRVMVTRRDQLQLQGSAPIVAIVVCTAVAVAAFCAVVAFAFEH